MLMPMPHKSRPFPLAPKDVTSSNDSTLRALQYLSQMGPEAARNLQSSDDFPVHTYLNPGTATDCCLMLLVAQVNISCRYPISFERPWCLLDLLHLSITSFPLRPPSQGRVDIFLRNIGDVLTYQSTRE